ncbi:MAG: hypothetical protein MO853_13495, partial [Candidatus Protistobacter heckmanni]|nr:hypothetical protein [Candidatus Protistobacter heckmanni]
SVSGIERLLFSCQFNARNDKKLNLYIAALIIKYHGSGGLGSQGTRIRHRMTDILPIRRISSAGPPNPGPEGPPNTLQHCPET